MLITQCIGTDLNSHQLYGDDKLICYGLKCIFCNVLRDVT